MQLWLCDINNDKTWVGCFGALPMFPGREVLLQNGSLAIATLISSVQKEKTWKTIDPKLPP